MRGALEEVGFQLRVALVVEPHMRAALAEAHRVAGDADGRAADVKEALALVFEEAMRAVGRDKHKDALEWYECWWGFHTLPKLNYTNPEVEEYFLKVAQFWLREAHTDATSALTATSRGGFAPSRARICAIDPVCVQASAADPDRRWCSSTATR